MCLDRKFLLTGILVLCFAGLLSFVSLGIALSVLTWLLVVLITGRVFYEHGYVRGRVSGLRDSVDKVTSYKAYKNKTTNNYARENIRLMHELDREKSRNARAERVMSECIEDFEKRLDESRRANGVLKGRLEISEKARSVDIEILNALRKIETETRKELNSAIDELEVIRSRLTVSEKVRAATAGTCEAWKVSCLAARGERDELRERLTDVERKLNKKRDKKGRFCK